MGALRSSSIVEGVDIGHLLAGIDAMLNPQDVAISIGRVSFQTSLGNEEWATWAGDVGSAAAEWALDQSYSRPSRGNLDSYFSDFAGASDLLGDIHSFAFRAGANQTATPPAQLRQVVRLGGPLSEALFQYFRLSATPLGQARTRPIQIFVEAYGGNIVNGSLTNRQVLIAALRPSVANFAGLFSLQEVLRSGDPPPRPSGTPSIGELLPRAIDEMTSRVVDWLAPHL
jgi:hypothetical protein